MYIDDRSRTRIRPREMLTVLKLAEAFKKSWRRDTAFPKDESRWDENHKTVGQCAVTAAIVQKKVGGTIHRNGQLHHYWNELPSGGIIDFTRDQFNINNNIPSDGTTTLKALLRGRGADQANTAGRYRRLNARVARATKGLKPTIFLLSSNAQTEYIEDILEAIAVPNGYILHFRYLLRYLDFPLRTLLPEKRNASQKNGLNKSSVIVVYLNQARIGSGNYTWNGSLPVRYGILYDCYRTGKEDNSVAHFFFKVTSDFVSADGFEGEFKTILGDSYGKSYAYVTFADTQKLGEKELHGKLFETQCDKLKHVGLDYQNRDGRGVKYQPPLMVLIEGMYRKHFRAYGRVLNPVCEPFAPGSAYKLRESRSYFLRLRTYNWDYKKPYTVKLKVSDSLFSTPEEYILNVHSAYDSQCWELTPAFVPRKTSGFIELSINADATDEVQSEAKELNWRVLTMLNVRRRFTFHFLDIISSILLALGPTYLALTKLLEDEPTQIPLWLPRWFLNEWYWVLIAIYGSWLLTVSVKKAIRSD